MGIKVTYGDCNNYLNQPKCSNPNLPTPYDTEPYEWFCIMWGWQISVGKSELFFKYSK